MRPLIGLYIQCSRCDGATQQHHGARVSHWTLKTLLLPACATPTCTMGVAGMHSRVCSSGVQCIASLTAMSLASFLSRAEPAAVCSMSCCLSFCCRFRRLGLGWCSAWPPNCCASACAGCLLGRSRFLVVLTPAMPGGPARCSSQLPAIAPDVLVTAVCLPTTLIRLAPVPAAGAVCAGCCSASAGFWLARYSRRPLLSFSLAAPVSHQPLYCRKGCVPAVHAFRCDVSHKSSVAGTYVGLGGLASQHGDTRRNTTCFHSRGACLRSLA